MTVVTEDCNVNTSPGSLHSDMMVVTEDCNVNTHAAQWHASSYWTPTVTDRDWETAIQEVDTYQAWDQLSLQFIANHQLALNNTSTCHITSPYTVPGAQLYISKNGQFTSIKIFKKDYLKF